MQPWFCLDDIGYEPKRTERWVAQARNVLGVGMRSADRNWSGEGIDINLVSDSGSHQQRLRDILDHIIDNIDDDCIAWLAQGTDPVTGVLINDLVPSQTVSEVIAVFRSLPAYGHGAIVDRRNPGSVINAISGGPYSITFNRNGSTFNTSAPRSSGIRFGEIQNINPGSLRQGVFTMLHEFGHTFSAPGFTNDRGSSNAVKANNDRVWENCSSTIKKAAN
jgi:hypothetical protein